MHLLRSQARKRHTRNTGAVISKVPRYSVMPCRDFMLHSGRKDRPSVTPFLVEPYPTCDREKGN